MTATNLTATRRPTVTIAMPVYNAESSVRRALDSALAQTFRDVEVVVVDNASTDATAEVLRDFEDDRLRIVANPENIGYHRNMNRAVQLSRGRFVKFLHADDALMPECVERMLRCFDDSGRVGLVFARRAVEVEDESDAELRWWRDTYGQPHRRFGTLAERNPGSALLHRYLAGDFDGNWLGEPSSVMMRRECFEALGLFSTRILVGNDLDMWARTMTSFDIGFVDEELSVFRIGHMNLTRAGKHLERDWLDRLWMLRGLAETPGARTRFPELQRMLRSEYRRVAWRYQAMVRRDPSQAIEKGRDLSRYAGYCIAKRVDASAKPYPDLAPVGAGAGSAEPVRSRERVIP